MEAAELGCRSLRAAEMRFRTMEAAELGCRTLEAAEMRYSSWRLQR